MHTPTFGPLDGKTEVARWAFTGPSPDELARQIDNYGTATAQIVLYEPQLGGEPVSLLETFQHTVEKVIDRFEVFFR
jgi:hypothetical protein